MAIDWTKPIQMENGEPLELLYVWPEGSPNFPDRTHEVFRPDANSGYVSVWWYSEDGKSALPGHSVVNRPENAAR